MSKLEKIENEILELELKIKDPKLCEGTAETYSRISGYYRPISQWNIGKKAEFSERVSYLT
jgi:anaerobic ribonucleoside-triphosphate reductase